jgi:hypothetical protein
MSQPTLSILIPTLTCRKHFYSAIFFSLQKQLTDKVELLTLCDNGEQSIGAKRNALLAQAKGIYTCFVDDDDAVEDDYVSSILYAAESRPDVITFKMARYMDGVHQVDQEFTLEEPSTRWQYEPNHLCPMLADIARSVSFPDINKGEDSAWAWAVNDKLKTEVHINAVLYHYLFRTRRLNEVSNQYRRDWGIDAQL